MMIGTTILLILSVVIFISLIIALTVFVFVFWILMIIDCATRKFKQESEKIVWIIVLVFLQILGAIIYYFVIKRPNKH